MTTTPRGASRANDNRFRRAWLARNLQRRRENTTTVPVLTIAGFAILIAPATKKAPAQRPGPKRCC
jgi:hypothetical protein